MPKVSVIIRSYNHEKFITECIQSVLEQTFQDFELIIIDDCSNDHSVKKIKFFSDSRIKFFIHAQNKGACVTHNDCLAKASGEYLALINSDDVWLKDKLMLQVQYLDANPDVGAVFTQTDLIDDDGNYLNQNGNHPLK